MLPAIRKACRRPASFWAEALVAPLVAPEEVVRRVQSELGLSLERDDVAITLRVLSFRGVIDSTPLELTVSFPSGEFPHVACEAAIGPLWTSVEVEGRVAPAIAPVMLSSPFDAELRGEFSLRAVEPSYLAQLIS